MNNDTSETSAFARDDVSTADNNIDNTDLSNDASAPHQNNVDPPVSEENITNEANVQRPDYLIEALLHGNFALMLYSKNDSLCCKATYKEISRKSMCVQRPPLLFLNLARDFNALSSLQAGTNEVIVEINNYFSVLPPDDRGKLMAEKVMMTWLNFCGCAFKVKYIRPYTSKVLLHDTYFSCNKCRTRDSATNRQAAYVVGIENERVIIKRVSFHHTHPGLVDTLLTE